MGKREMVCIICPIGCHMEIIADANSETGYNIQGATCKRGEIYAIKELTNPTRVITSTVKIKDGFIRRLPVKTNIDISKDKIFDCMKIINVIEVQAPITIGDIIVENILDTGVNIIATKTVAKVK